jgi:hypothetical protein
MSIGKTTILEPRGLGIDPQSKKDVSDRSPVVPRKRVQLHLLKGCRFGQLGCQRKEQNCESDSI